MVGRDYRNLPSRLKVNSWRRSFFVGLLAIFGAIRAEQGHQGTRYIQKFNNIRRTSSVRNVQFPNMGAIIIQFQCSGIAERKQRSHQTFGLLGPHQAGLFTQVSRGTQRTSVSRSKAKLCYYIVDFDEDSKRMLRGYGKTPDRFMKVAKYSGSKKYNTTNRIL